MRYRSILFCALASVALLGACGEDDDFTGIGDSHAATIRFANATNSNITIAEDGDVAAGNSALGFGAGSSCMRVNAADPQLTFTNSTTGQAITTFTPALAENGNYTIIAYTDASGNTQFATLNNGFTPVVGQGGLRVFNAASGSGNVVLNANGSALNGGATTSFPNAGAFFSTPTTATVYTFNTGAGTTSIAATASTGLNANRNATVVLGPAATGSTALRAFVTPAC
jgi:hypothetical protein